MLKGSESQEHEMTRQRDHQLLFDMIADLREYVQKRGRLITSETPQSREPLPQVSLAWPHCVGAQGIQCLADGSYRGRRTGRYTPGARGVVLAFQISRLWVFKDLVLDHNLLSCG
jgi:hypothetical protein